MIIDLHVHTTLGSPDSGLTPQHLVAEAKRIGLDGVILTEHHYDWDREQVRALAQQNGLTFIPSLEISTDLGHVSVLGLDGYTTGIYKAEVLRRLADEKGAFIIALHPFRFFPTRPEPSLSQATALPLVQLCDEIEVANGGCTPLENALAYRVAKSLGRQGVGGSDAHSIQGLGCFATVFEGHPTTVQELIAELRAGRYHAVQGLPHGKLSPFVPTEWKTD